MASGDICKHHFVPVLLLKNFTDAEGLIWVYDLEKKQLRYSSTKRVGFERNLYAIIGEDGKIDHGTIEEKLRDYIDGPGHTAIERLLRHEQLEADHWQEFVGFVATQLHRTPTFMKRLGDVARPLMEEMKRRMARSDPEFRASIRKDFLEMGMTEDQIEAELAEAATSAYPYEPPQQMLLVMALNQIPKTHEELNRMHWQIMTLDAGDSDLLLGDHPAILIAPEGELRGLRNPNLSVVLPLSKRVAARANWDGPTLFGTFGKGMADIIN
ncbi:MAG: hypothetical protein JWM47_4581 [Acidimicrobiales bacterium]|nr:hypothetical protein [Acidimicrobiales bacterium]